MTIDITSVYQLVNMREIKSPTQLTVNMDRELRRSFKIQCEKAGKTMTVVLTEFVQQVVEHGVSQELVLVKPNVDPVKGAL